jgi:4-hydroxybenzoate polyprenyltransferase
MREPSSYQKVQWGLIKHHSKMFGYGLTIGSLVFIIQAIAYMFGAKINGGGFPLYLLPLFVILFVLGVLVIRAKPYDPKKYRQWFERKKKSSTLG